VFQTKINQSMVEQGETCIHCWLKLQLFNSNKCGPHKPPSVTYSTTRKDKQSHDENECQTEQQQFT